MIHGLMLQPAKMHPYIRNSEEILDSLHLHVHGVEEESVSAMLCMKLHLHTDPFRKETRLLLHSLWLGVHVVLYKVLMITNPSVTRA